MKMATESEFHPLVIIVPNDMTVYIKKDVVLMICLYDMMQNCTTNIQQYKPAFVKYLKVASH